MPAAETVPAEQHSSVSSELEQVYVVAVEPLRLPNWGAADAIRAPRARTRKEWVNMLGSKLPGLGRALEKLGLEVVSEDERGKVGEDGLRMQDVGGCLE